MNTLFPTIPLNRLPVALIASLGLVLATVSCNDTPLTSGNPRDAVVLDASDLVTTGQPLQCNANQRLLLNTDLAFVVDNSASQAGYYKAPQNFNYAASRNSIAPNHQQNHNRIGWYAGMTDCQASQFQFTGNWSKDERGQNFQPLGRCSTSYRRSMIDPGFQYYRNAQANIAPAARKRVAITRFPAGGNIPRLAGDSYHGRWLDPVNSFSLLSSQATQFLFSPQGDTPAVQAISQIRSLANTAPSRTRGVKPVIVIVTDGFATDSYQQLQQLLAQSAAIRQNATVYVFLTMAGQTFQVHKQNFSRAMSERNNGANLAQYLALNVGSSPTGFQNSFYQRLVGERNFIPITSGAAFQSLLFHVLRRDQHVRCI
jgi:hypothetical protein